MKLVLHQRIHRVDRRPVEANRADAADDLEAYERVSWRSRVIIAQATPPNSRRQMRTMTAGANSRERLLAAAGVVGPCVFIADWAILGTRAKNYSPVSDAISELARMHASTRPAMTAGFLVFGAALPTYAVALRESLPGHAWKFAAANGVATLGVAAFSLGTPTSGDIHGVFAGLAYASPRRDTDRRERRAAPRRPPGTCPDVDCYRSLCAAALVASVAGPTTCTACFSASDSRSATRGSSTSAISMMRGATSTPADDATLDPLRRRYSLTRQDKPVDIWPGHWQPLGATVDDGGTNFALFSATRPRSTCACSTTPAPRPACRCASRRFTSGMATCRASAPAPATATASMARSTPRTARSSTPNKLLADPYALALDGAFVLDDADIREQLADRLGRVRTEVSRRARRLRLGRRSRTGDRVGGHGAFTSCTSAASPCNTPTCRTQLRGTYAGLAHPSRYRPPETARRHDSRTHADAPLRERDRRWCAAACRTTGGTTPSDSSHPTPATRRPALVVDRFASSRRW